MITEGHFYRDADGDVWQAGRNRLLQFVARADSDPDVAADDVRDAEEVARRYGPLVEVRPTGWEEV